MTDYQTLIDAPTWAFIEKTNASYPENTATLSLTEQRAIYDRMCSLRHPLPDQRDLAGRTRSQRALPDLSGGREQPSSSSSSSQSSS